MRTKIGFLSVWITAGLISAAQMFSPAAAYILPLWSGGQWHYLTLGPAFKVSGNAVDVPVTQGPAGPAGPAGPVGSTGLAGAPAVFIPVSNDVYVLTAAQSVFSLRCSAADVYRDGMMQSEGADITVDPSALTATFGGTAIPQSGDVVKITYRCAFK